jgi:nitrogen fixation/metabolism regulation signal transduction histidine kinase
MTLRARIVAALVLAALIPMAVVLAVPLVQAEKRANEETGRLMAHAREQAEALVENERSTARSAADRAAESLATDRNELAALLRGRESVAWPVAGAIAARDGLDRVEILGSSGMTLAVYETAGPAAGTAALVERRRVPADSETLTLVATRALGASFVSLVSKIAGGNARLGSPGAATCVAPYVEVRVGDDAALCVSVRPADARDVRHDLLKSFAGVAPVAFLAALAVGFVLAGRIARPVRDLAERAESIAAQRRHPITLLPEREETRRMTLAFDQMLDALESSERRRLSAERIAAWEEIAKRLAHEIKNPLSPIQLAVENLERTKRLSPDTFDEAFVVETRTILEEVGSLRALVDEFAQFARLPRPRVAPCDPRAIAESALALFSARIDTMRVAARIDAAEAPATIHGDAEQLGRVLKNVIANALDAMENAAERTLAVTVRREGDRVSFAVSDTGRGFDQETLRRVFEPYFTTRSDRGGTGLGMAIARRIAVEHGGALTAAGAPGRGATITLTVPVEGPPSEDA